MRSGEENLGMRNISNLEVNEWWWKKKSVVVKAHQNWAAEDEKYT